MLEKLGSPRKDVLFLCSSLPGTFPRTTAAGHYARAAYGSTSGEDGEQELNEGALHIEHIRLELGRYRDIVSMFGEDKVF
jgi:hypothetical protein